MILVSTWVVNLIEGREQKFFDIQQLKGNYYEMQPEWIEKLQSLIKRHPDYKVHINLIESVSGPRREGLIAPFLLLLVTKTQLTVTFLGELTEDNTGVILGVWPKNFLKILDADDKAILNLLYVIIEQSELVAKLDLIF